MVWYIYIPPHPLSPLLLCLGIVRVLVVLVLSLLQLLLLATLVAHNLPRANQRGDRVKRRVIVVWRGRVAELQRDGLRAVRRVCWGAVAAARCGLADRVVVHGENAWQR